MEKKQRPLLEVVAYFTKLGFLGFGGPFAIMAALQKDLIEKRKWIEPTQFLQALALMKALPGPIATQLAIYLGYSVSGRLGGLAAGICLVLPAFFMMIALGAIYSSSQELAWAKPLLFGMQATALGVIVESIWRLANPYRRQSIFWLVALLAAVLMFYWPSYEPITIVGLGILGVLLTIARERFIYFGAPVLGAIFFLCGNQTNASFLWGSSAYLPQPLFYSLALVFLKAGAFVFGTGLAIVPLLSHDVVTQYHWLSYQEFLDALAFGQITPGPVVITSTFIGYKVAGLAGACIATFCVFAPSFFNILTWFPYVEKKLATKQGTQIFVQWAVAAVVGSIAITITLLALQILRTEAPSGGQKVFFIGLSLVGFILSLRSSLPPWSLIPLGGIAYALGVHFSAGF